LRAIGRFLQNVFGFKEAVENVWRIRETKVCQRVTQKEVTKIIDAARRRYGMVWEKREAEYDGRGEKQKDFSQAS